MARAFPCQACVIVVASDWGFTVFWLPRFTAVHLFDKEDQR